MGAGPDAWRLVVPVKPLTAAKSRLAPATGAYRGGLALAFAVDTVRAALSCRRVAGVLVVTDDPVVAEQVRAEGAETVADVQGQDGRGRPGGLNAALEHGAGLAGLWWPGAGVAALSADLPALRPEELDRVLGEAGRRPRAFLADAAGVGTTLLAAWPGTVLAPAFEGASRARHRRSGAHELVLDDVDSVRRDVDTGADLARAVELGVGPRTAALLPLLSAGC
ncbi:2-phospho-L-lactate guanylyltransferase [Yinghuangia seranimata]|nr:2-phospho-L-lactate guanylyltransferase [Yinghuangia seranimata]MDI2129316.1 2-phospho-L-lactate guanylyltransferase [Yinghuangia seranimata]